QRQTPNDRERMTEALDLRCEDNVDEHNSQQDCDCEVIRGLCQLTCASTEHQRVSWLHVQFTNLFANRSNGIAKRQAIEAGVQLDIALAVLTPNGVWGRIPL